MYRKEINMNNALKCNFCGKDNQYLLCKNNLYICKECIEEFANTLINNKINIKLELNDFKIKRI